VKAVLVAVVLAAATTAAADTSTGVFDFQLGNMPGAYVLHDEAYSLTFPMKPSVKKMDSDAADGTKVWSLTALAGNDDVFYGMSVTPVGRDLTYNAKKGLDMARDGMMNAVKAKVTGSKPIKMAGRDGRAVTATVPIAGRTGYLEMHEMWDGDHRAVVVVTTILMSPGPSKVAQTFYDSFSIQAAGKGPIDVPSLAPDAPTETGVLDMQMVRHGNGYAIHDDALDIAFPVPPTLKLVNDSPPLYGFYTNNYTDEVEGFGAFVLFVPASVQYDADKGLDGARDGLLKELDNAKPTEIKTKVAGVPGRKILATASFNGVPVHVEALLAWDPKHRMAVGVMTTTKNKATTKAGRVFLDSFTIGTGKAPAGPTK
jgi:hypothetical protein